MIRATRGQVRTAATIAAIPAVLGASLVLGLASVHHAASSTIRIEASPRSVTQADYETDTVNLSELPGIDSMPVCSLEDGSDVDPALLPCVWSNDGNDWLTFADRSFLIVDDTAHLGHGVLPGAVAR